MIDASESANTESLNDSCNQNVTLEAVKQGAIVIAASGIACFILNLVGLTSELVYICRKKNTFLLRLFVYMSISVTMSVGSYSLYTATYFKPQDELLCEIIHTLFHYSIAVELSLIFSIDMILLYKVCSSRFRFCGGLWNEQISDSKRKCLEVLFVVLNFGLPVIAFTTFLGIIRKGGVCFTENHNIQCYLREEYILVEFLIFELFPVLFDSFLSFICICVLLTWLCWLRNRFLLKTQMKTVIKEIGTWLGFLTVYCIVSTLLVILNFVDNALLRLIALVFYPLLHSLISLSFFGYLCVSLCPRSNKVLVQQNRVKRINSLHSDTLQTTPSSTRVSLPSDTAEHAPNFLSPLDEDTSEVTPLLAT